jgi:class 3 adenylate cyclase
MAHRLKKARLNKQTNRGQLSTSFSIVPSYLLTLLALPPGARNASQHGVFKIETISYCYMAMTGLPEPQEAHAVRVVRFARECMIVKAPQVLRRLVEVFDTVNTASRMESNAMKGRLHVSQTTADELTKAGKSHWLIPREDKIVVKGKGEMQTYWLSR